MKNDINEIPHACLPPDNDKLVREVMEKYPKECNELKMKFRALVGKAMQTCKGSANPSQVAEAFKRLLLG